MFRKTLSLLILTVIASASPASAKVYKWAGDMPTREVKKTAAYIYQHSRENGKTYRRAAEILGIEARLAPFKADAGDLEE
jgi:hypothetical protein